MWICSNKPYGLCIQVLNDIDLVDKFKVVIGGDSLPTMKPEPESLEAVISMLGFQNHQGMFLGDSQYDFKAAKRAGITYMHHKLGYEKNPDPKNSLEYTYAELVKSLLKK